MAPVFDFTLPPRSPYPIPLTDPLTMIDRGRRALTSTATHPVHPDAARAALRSEVSVHILCPFSEAVLTWLLNNGGHKTVRLAKKKGGSSEFYCFVTFFFFETKQIKFLRVLAPFFWFLKRDF